MNVGFTAFLKPERLTANAICLFAEIHICRISHICRVLKNRPCLLRLSELLLLLYHRCHFLCENIDFFLFSQQRLIVRYLFYGTNTVGRHMILILNGDILISEERYFLEVKIKDLHSCQKLRLPRGG